jgi:hypothetical protein
MKNKIINTLLIYTYCLIPNDWYLQYEREYEWILSYPLRIKITPKNYINIHMYYVMKKSWHTNNRMN